MLQKMHERMQGIVMTIIIVAICLAFALWGIQYYLHSSAGGDNAAKVGNIKIARQQLEAAVQRARHQIMAKEGKDFVFTQKIQQQLKQQVLQQLVKAEAFYQGAEKAGFGVGTREIDANLVQIPIFQINGQFSKELFMQRLSEMLYSEWGFIRNLQKQIVAAQLQVGIVGSEFMLPEEVKSSVELLQQQRDIQYATISAKNFLNKVTVTKEEIANYYQQNKPQFTIPAKLKLDYIELNANALKLQAPITEQQLQQYYDDNIGMYTQPEKWQISFVFVPVLRSASKGQQRDAYNKAEQLAQSQSFGKANWVTAAEISKNFLSALQALKPNQASKPIKVANGYYVIKLLKDIPEKILAFAQVKDQVKKAVTNQQLTKIYDQKSDKLADVTYTSSDSLRAAAKELGLKIQTTDWVEQGGTKSGITANPIVMQAAFSNTVLKQRYNSDPIQLTPDSTVVIRINKYQPEQTKTLTEVQDQIKATLQLQKATKAAQQDGERLIAAAKVQKNFSKVVLQNSLTLKSVNKLQRNNTVLPAQLVTAAFSLPNPNSGPAIGGVSLPNGDYVLINVNKIYPGDISKLTPKQLQAFKDNLTVSRGDYYFETYGKQLSNHIKVELFRE